MNPVSIGNRSVGPGSPCFVIAEAGVNHNGDIELAYQLIDAAVSVGADAIKFQGFNSEELATARAPMADYQLKATSRGKNQLQMLKQLELTKTEQAKLRQYCTDAGILYLCTPYDFQSVNMLCDMKIAAFKIAATDVTNTPFLEYVGAKNLPVILSTGMSSLSEVELAMQTLRSEERPDKLVLLHCTSAYPAPMDEANLRAMATLKQAFCCPVGYSDHTVGMGAGLVAVAMGACVIEKHFTLDRALPGPDHQASLPPAELSEYIEAIRIAETCMGDGIKRPMPSELENKAVMQKSLVARYAMRAGDRIEREAIACKRPGTGLPPSWLNRLVGLRLSVNIAPDELFSMAHIEWPD